MSLPHFHTMPNLSEPIFKNLYEGIFITNDGEQFLSNIERFEIMDNIIVCKIQDYPETSMSNIKNSTILLIEHFNKVGNIIRIDIFGIEILNYKSDFNWESVNLSYIDASFTITSNKSLHGNDLSHLNKEAFIKSLMRDKKLTKLLS